MVPTSRCLVSECLFCYPFRRSPLYRSSQVRARPSRQPSRFRRTVGQLAHERRPRWPDEALGKLDIPASFRDVLLTPSHIAGHSRTSTRLTHPQSLLTRSPSRLLPLRRPTLHSRRCLRLRHSHPLRHPLHRPTRRRRHRPNSRARRQLLGDGLEGQHRWRKE